MTRHKVLLPFDVHYRLVQMARNNNWSKVQTIDKLLSNLSSPVTNSNFPFNLSCNRCGSRNISPHTLPFRKNIMDVQKDVKINNYNKIKDWIFELLKMINQDFYDFITLFLQHDARALDCTISLTPKRTAELCGMQAPTKAEILSIKDNIGLSDEKYEIIRRRLMFKQIPCKQTLYRFRKDINTRILNRYDINYSPDSVSCSIVQVMSDIIDVAKAHGERVSNPCFKICMDGQRYKDGQTTIGIVPIDIYPFSTQRDQDYFPIAMWYGDEEDPHGCLKKIVSEINEVQFDSRIIWVSDLGALAKVSNLYERGQFCIFCCCPSSQRNDMLSRWESRNIEILNSQFEVGIESLHSIENITRKLLEFSSGFGDPELVDQIEQDLNQTKVFDNFRLNRHKNSNRFEVKKIKCKEAIYIVNNFADIFNSFDEHDYLIWEVWKFIMNKYLLVCQNMLNKRMQRDPELKNEISIIEKWGKIIAQVYQTSNFGYYLHIVIHHLINSLKTQPLPSMLSMQGAERFHSRFKYLDVHATNNSNKSLLQIIQKPLRSLYLCLKYEMKWGSPIYESVDNEGKGLIQEELEEKKILQKVDQYLNN
eukprot:gb/GECH01002349.1/.p1 GENE.gb/GECH01002349.1/~~gb/GECH01002349.1/.p1  ORF type:complete len:591 (+),score=21.70 gb/GECH01002349.1/:1-1773(+)